MADTGDSESCEWGTLHDFDIDSQRSTSSDSIKSDYSPSDPLLCHVCGDKASGYHYSVYSCEGCKGFFKRTVQKALVYTCRDTENCVINKFTRNNCQYCRFKKCLVMGMQREGVREDRTPGGRHRNKRPRQSRSSKEVTKPSVSGAFVRCDELTQKLIQAKPNLSPSLPDYYVPGQARTIDCVGIHDVLRLGYEELRLIIQWAKKVPGFMNLCLEDRIALLKSSFLDLNILRITFRSMSRRGCCVFGENVVVNAEEAAGLGWGKDLVNAALDYGNKLQQINLDVVEFCFLNALILTFADSEGLQGKDHILCMQKNILESFRNYTKSKYNDPGKRYAKILLRLPSLRKIGSKAIERFRSLHLGDLLEGNTLAKEMMS